MLGILSKNVGSYDKALDYYHASLKIRESLADNIAMARSYSNIGNVHRNLGEYEIALNYYFKSLAIREKMQDSIEIGKLYNNIGTFYQAQREYDKAIDLFEKSLHIQNILGDRREIASVLNNLGISHYSMGNYSDALTLYEKSIEIKNEFGDLIGVANSYSNMAIIYEDQDSTRKALESHAKSIKIRESLGDKKGIAGASNNIGFLYKNQGEYGEALKYLEKSYVLAQETGVLEYEHQAAQNLSEIYATLGRYEEAFRYHQRFSALKDSLFNEEKAKEIGRLEATFEAQKEIDAKAAELRQRTLQRNATFGGLGLVSLLAFVIIRGYQQRQRAARLLAEQKEKINSQLIVDLLQEQELESLSALMEGQEQERKRIAGDLHDRMGSKLATVRLHFSGMGEVLPQTNDLPQYATAMRLLDEACGEVRQIAHNMASGVLTHFGLVAALRDMAETLQHSGRIKAQVYEFEMEGRRLDSSVEIALYRVVQELISNVLKHARATEVSIHLTHHGDSLNLMIEDNGTGFHYDPESAASDGMGLGNIRQRIAKLGGQLGIDTAPRQGTTVIIDVPVAVSEKTIA